MALRRKSDYALLAEVMYRYACNHFRATAVFLSAVAKTCEYQTESCEPPDCGGTSYRCKGNGLGSGIRIPPYTDCDPNDDRHYILQTASKAPFCNPETK